MFVQEVRCQYVTVLYEGVGAICPEAGQGFSEIQLVVSVHWSDNGVVYPW